VWRSPEASAGEDRSERCHHDTERRSGNEDDDESQDEGLHAKRLTEEPLPSSCFKLLQFLGSPGLIEREGSDETNNTGCKRCREVRHTRTETHK
jgi:hypothetical protein